MGRQGVAVYPWITEAYEILKPLLPCSENDAIAALVTGMTFRAVNTATKNKTQSGSRVSAAKTALRYLKKFRLTICDGIIDQKNSISSKSIGVRVMAVLHNKGVILESETGFKASSISTYRSVLKSLGWIRLEPDKWIWIGPCDATWEAVCAKNAKRRS